MVLQEFFTWFINTSEHLIATFGYFGVFLVGVMGSATVFLPIPSYAVVFLMGATLNPLLLGIAAGIGSSVGELVGYTLGRGGRHVIAGRNHLDKQLNDMEKLFQKYGGFLAIIIVAATPLPDNVLGIFCGIIKYPMKNYFIASTIGKLIMYIFLAYAGYYAIDFILSLFAIPL